MIYDQGAHEDRVNGGRAFLNVHVLLSPNAIRETDGNALCRIGWRCRIPYWPGSPVRAEIGYLIVFEPGLGGTPGYEGQ